MLGTEAVGRERGSFLEHLVRALRGAGEEVAPDFEMLAPFIARPGAAAIGAADPDAFWRIEAFFQAIGAEIEEQTGIACVAIVRMRREGFGTVLLIAGRLVAVSRWFDDASAFRFESVEALAVAGERLVREGMELIARYPDVARAPQ